MAKMFSNSQPIYMQLAEELCRRICKGHLKAGDKLPSVREAAQGLGVNPNTIQRTYADLEKEGLIERRRGLGSYVTINNERIKDLKRKMVNQQIELFLHSMRDIGLQDQEIISITIHEMLLEQQYMNE